jgi:hypothetical protein
MTPRHALRHSNPDFGETEEFGAANARGRGWYISDTSQCSVMSTTVPVSNDGPDLFCETAVTDDNTLCVNNALDGRDDTTDGSRDKWCDFFPCR